MIDHLDHIETIYSVRFLNNFLVADRKKKKKLEPMLERLNPDFYKLSAHDKKRFCEWLVRRACASCMYHACMETFLILIGKSIVDKISIAVQSTRPLRRDSTVFKFWLELTAHTIPCMKLDVRTPPDQMKWILASSCHVPIHIL